MQKPKSNRSLLRRIPRAEREVLAKQIREAIAEEHLPKLLADIEADPEGWSVVYHFGGGRDVRNLLRFQGFTEKWPSLPSRRDHPIDVVLDEIWAPLVELAMQGYDPPPDVRKSMKRRPVNHRWQARRRAYSRAAAAAAAARDAQAAKESAECA